MAKAEIKNRIRRLRFENNDLPSLALAFRIARVFGVLLEDVFEYEEQ